MALLSSPRLPHAIAIFVVGIAACGVSLALAGTTPKPPADPIDSLPADLEKVRDFTCTRDLLTAVQPTTTIETVGGAMAVPCWRVALVWSTKESSNEIADRLAQHFTARGFQLNGPTTGIYRSYYGRLAECGTILAIDTGSDAASAPPGARSALGAAVDPATGIPLGPGGVQGAPVIPSIPSIPMDPTGALGPGGVQGAPVIPSIPMDPTGALGPAASTPGAATGATDTTIPVETIPPGGPNVAIDPRMSPDQILLNEPWNAPGLLGRTTRPAMAMVSVQQSRSVAPAGGRC